MGRLNESIFRLTRLCTAHPKTVVALTLIFTVVMGFFARNVQRDHSMERMLPKNDPIRMFYDDFKEHFDIRSKFVLAIYHPRGVFTPEVLTQIDRLSGQLEALDDVEEVQSLTTVENIASAEGVLTTHPLIETIPSTLEQAQALRRAVATNTMIRKGMVSEDENGTILFVQPTYEPFETAKCLEGSRKVLEVIRNDPGPGTLHLAGLPLVIAQNNRNMDLDNRIMLPIIALTVIILLWFSFRSLRGIWIPISVVVAAVIWTYGTLGLFAQKTTIISASIPIVLVAMGIADGIHVLHEYYHNLRNGHGNLDSIHRTMREMNSPVIMTSLTTAVGFLALCTSSIVPIREYGVSVAFGILAAMVFSLTFIPAGLALLGKPKKIPSLLSTKRGVLERFCLRMGDFSFRKGRLILTLFALALIVTSILSVFLEVRNNPVHYFRKGSEVRQADDFLNRHFIGTGEVVAQIDGQMPGAMKDPVLLDRLRQVREQIQTLAVVGRTSSILDFLERMNVVLNDDNPEFDRLPGTRQDLGKGWTPDAGRAKIAQYLLLYEMADGKQMGSLVDFNYQRANLRVHVRSNNSTDYRQVVDRIQESFDQILGDGTATLGLTGPGPINLKVVQYLVLGQVFSLAVGLVAVFFMLVILFRSLVYALIGIIPLVITVSTNFAVMVLTDIPLNMGTALIASVIIGVGVDYSIHFIHRYRLERKRNGQAQTALATTMETSGRAILFNAMSVGGGFAVLLFSSFMPVVYLGLLVPVVMAVNAFAALLVIPVFLNLKNHPSTPPLA